jgi:carbon-monoxide dehydrogenase medium subunit
MYPFTYERASSLQDSVQGLRNDAEAKLLAGGMTLLPTMKMRLAAPSRLIDITRLADLRGITREGNSVLIGAAQRHGEVATDPTVCEAIPALADLAGRIGDPQVRARGTLGGSIANYDPAADYPAALLGLDATVITDRRSVAAADFFLGLFTTALEPDEIIRAVRFTLPRRAAYAKFAQPASGYAMAGVMVAQLDAGIRVAVTGAGPGVFRWHEAEAALGRKWSTDAIADCALDASTLNTDLHGSAAYRAQLVRVMAAQAIGRLDSAAR